MQRGRDFPGQPGIAMAEEALSRGAGHRALQDQLLIREPGDRFGKGGVGSKRLRVDDVRGDALDIRAAFRSEGLAEEAFGGRERVPDDGAAAGLVADEMDVREW